VEKKPNRRLWNRRKGWDIVKKKKDSMRGISGKCQGGHNDTGNMEEKVLKLTGRSAQKKKRGGGGKRGTRLGEEKRSRVFKATVGGAGSRRGGRAVVASGEGVRSGMPKAPHAS